MRVCEGSHQQVLFDRRNVVEPNQQMSFIGLVPNFNLQALNPADQESNKSS